MNKEPKHIIVDDAMQAQIDVAIAEKQANNPEPEYQEVSPQEIVDMLGESKKAMSEQANVVFEQDNKLLQQLEEIRAQAVTVKVEDCLKATSLSQLMKIFDDFFELTRTKQINDILETIANLRNRLNAKQDELKQAILAEVLKAVMHQFPTDEQKVNFISLFATPKRRGRKKAQKAEETNAEQKAEQTNAE